MPGKCRSSCIQKNPRWFRSEYYYLSIPAVTGDTVLPFDGSITDEGDPVNAVSDAVSGVPVDARADATVESRSIARSDTDTPLRDTTETDCSAGRETGVVTDTGESLMDLHDAVLLDDHDPLLRCLDVWLSEAKSCHADARFSDDPSLDSESSSVHCASQELDWAPCSAPDRPVVLSLALKQGDRQSISLSMPMSDYHCLPGLPDDWSEFVKCERHVVKAYAYLSEFEVTIDEREKIEEGSMVLLPASFASHWHINMKTDVLIASAAVSQLSSCDAMLDTSTDEVRLFKPEAIAVDEKSTLEAVPDTEASIAGEVCVGDRTITTNADDEAGGSEADDITGVVVDHHSDLESPARVTVVLDQPFLFNSVRAARCWGEGFHYSFALGASLQCSAATLILARGRNTADVLRWPGTLVSVGEGWGILLHESRAG